MSDRGRILAVDYGEKNVGLACSDELALTVSPLPSLPNRGKRDILRRIAAAVSGLTIVTADGSVIQCSEEHEPEVFQAGRVSICAFCRREMIFVGVIRSSSDTRTDSQ